MRIVMRGSALALALTLSLTVSMAVILLVNGPAWAHDETEASRTTSILANGAPEMQSVHPVSNTHTAPLTTSVRITYDQPMSPTAVSTQTYAVHAMQTGLLSQTYGVDGGTIALTPTSAFRVGELVQASATTGTVNITGTEPLSPIVWQFRAKTFGGSGIMTFKGNVSPEAYKTWDVALGDLDGDGNLDLAVVNKTPTSTVHLGNGDGTFDGGIVFGSANSTRAVALGDLDGDGDLDIVRGRDGVGEVCLNDGTVPFSATCHSEGGDWKTNKVALGDMDGDGDLDIVMSNQEERSAVLFNNGDGTFPTSAIFGPYTSPQLQMRSLALGDLNGDGTLDVATGTWFGVRVFPNSGDGTALGTGTLYGPSGADTHAIALGDLDGDGDLDMLMGRRGHIDQVLLNDGDGTFDTTIYDLDTQVNSPWDMELGDLDGDGDLDIVTANYLLRPNRTYLNDGDGTFPTVYEHQYDTHQSGTYSAALGDLDGDGDLDMVAGNWDDENKIYLNRHLADVTMTKTAKPAAGGLDQGQAVTYTLEFENVGVVTATGVVITDIVPVGSSNWSVAGNSGAAITPTAGYTFAWTVADLAPGEGGIITLTRQSQVGQCGLMVNTAIITTTSPEDDGANNQDTVTRTVGVPLYVESIDAGASLTVNGDAAPAGSTICLDPGQTVTLTTSFDGEVYYDVIEAYYPLDVAVRATITDSSQVFLDEDMGYSLYDIYVIHNTQNDCLDVEMYTPPSDDAVKIIGLHLKGPEFELYALGDPAHTGSPVGLADVFYGTVESSGSLDVHSTCDGDVGSAFNKIVADEVWFANSDCSDATDQMIQEVYAGIAHTNQTEISWWHMVVTGQFSTGYREFEGYSLNDELPEQDTLEDDAMVWFKARNPGKWDLRPLTIFDGQGYDKAWDFENYYYGDYNFWEIHLGGDFDWYNSGYGEGLEYAHFLGPVMEMDSFTWTPEELGVYLNFFGDNSTNYDHKNRFDGDYGSAGKDFWKPLLTTDYGYTKMDGNIVSPVFVWRLREGYFEGGWYTTTLTLANGQDLLILSDSDELEFNDTDPSYGIHFFQGTNAHWVVEDGLTYSGTVPTDDDFTITLHDFITSTDIAPALVVTASNDYDGSGSETGIQAPGDDVNSTMYLVYREVGAYSQQLTKAPMTYDAGSGCWSVAPDIEPGVYDFYVVATENDGIYGKVIERLSVQISDVVVDESPPIADAGPHQEIHQGQVVQLDGSASYDPDGNEPLTYSWTQTNGTPTMSLSDSYVVSPTFAASSPGVFAFSLIVTDAVGRASTPDEVVITVTNLAPIADAGSNLSVDANALVTLDGSRSSDSDGDLPLAYRWTQTGGPAVSFMPNLSVTTFTAPGDPAMLTFTLGVTDNVGLPDSTPDEVVITVEGHRIYLPLVIR